MQMSENDLNHRRALYAIGVLSKQELEEKLKAEEDAAAAEDDDDEWCDYYERPYQSSNCNIHQT